MADKKNFSLTGIGSNVQIGKSGGRIKFSVDHLEARNAADSGFIDVYVPLTPGDDQAAASKSYVDEFTTTLIDAKNSVRVATTADGPFTTAYDNGSSIDAVVLATGDRLLIKDQADPAENGIYIVQGSGAPVRANDANTDAEMTQGAFCFVVLGTQNAKKSFILATPDPITLDVTGQTWVEGVATTTPILDAKDSVRVATTANGALATAYENADTIDAVVLATGDRILLKDQSTGAENGIYVVNVSGPPTRASDADTDAKVTQGAFCFVAEGTANAKKNFLLTTADPIIVDTDAQVWEEVSGGGGGFSFGIVTGDTGTATADAATDTLQLQGATNGGITTIATDAPELVTFGLTPIDFATTGATIAAADFLIVSDSTDSSTTIAQKVTFTSALNDLGVPFTGGNLDINILDIKLSVRIATTANISLTGEQTIDGITTSTDRILVKNQSTGSENGIYVTDASTWSRATDSDTDAEVTQGNVAFVAEGTANGKTSFILTTVDPITVGSTAQVWESAGGGGGATEIDDLTDLDTTTITPNVENTLGWDGSNWVPDAASRLEVGQFDLLHVIDEKTAGTDGGSSSVTTWNIRDLNTIRINEITGASLASNQITLSAGTYYIEATAPARKATLHKLRLRNVTDSATLIVGTSQVATISDTTGTNSFLYGHFTLTSTKTLELQHYTEAAFATWGLGTATDAIEVEVYADVRIHKITPVQTVAGLPFSGAQISLDSGSAQTIEDEVTEEIIWLTDDYDFGGWIDNSTNKRFKIPAGVIRAKFDCLISLSGQALGTIILILNEETLGTVSIHTQDSANVAGTENVSVSFPLTEVTEGQVYFINIFQNSNTSETLPVAGNNDPALFTVRAIESTVPSAKSRGALATLSADLTDQNHSTDTAISFDAEEYDTDSIHDLVTNNSRLTVPLGVNKVKLSGGVQIGNLTTSQYTRLAIRKNGVTGYSGYTVQEQEISASIHIMSNVNGPVIDVVPGDYFELFLLTEGDISIDFIEFTTWFAMEIIEPAVIVGDLFFDSTIQTTDATKVNIVRGLLAAGEVSTIFGEGQGIETSTGDVYWFTISGAVKNISGTTSLIGTAKITEDSDTGAVSWTVGLEADDTADAWELTVTGQAAKTIEWKISHKEVKQ